MYPHWNFKLQNMYKVCFLKAKIFNCLWHGHKAWAQTLNKENSKCCMSCPQNKNNEKCHVTKKHELGHRQK
jgi:hypothetical protein